MKAVTIRHRCNMIIENLWPTQVATGKFEIPGLVEHILTNYDLQSPPSDVGGYNILEDDSDVIIDFEEMVYQKFDDYLKQTINKKITDYRQYEMKGWITGHGKDYSMTIHNQFRCAPFRSILCTSRRYECWRRFSFIRSTQQC